MRSMAPILAACALAAITVAAACQTSRITRGVVAAVSVSAERALVFVGDSVRLTVDVTDDGGSPVLGKGVSWKIENPQVASVSESGVVRGLAPGAAQVVATVDDVRGSAVIQVTSIPEPTVQAGDVVLRRDAFDYTSTSALSGPYALRGAQQIVPGRSGSAVRFPYTASNYDNLIEFTFPATTDIYVSYAYRLSPGADPTCGNRNGSGMKWFMAWRAGGPRYTNGVGSLGPASQQAGLEFTTHDNSSSQMPNPFLQNINKSLRFGTTNDGNWHRYTLRIVTGARGYEQLWVDGALVLDSSPFGYDHAAEGISMIQMPGAMVSWSSGCDFSVDIDDLVVWRK